MVEKGLFTGVECGQAFQGLLRRFLAYGGEGFVYWLQAWRSIADFKFSGVVVFCISDLIQRSIFERAYIIR